MLPERYRHVAVEGPIGVGKTSLTRRLAGCCGAAMLLEKPEDNPFLPEFYQEPWRHALSTQLFFLMQRINEVSGLALSKPPVARSVADYLFDKDRLFARLNLSEEEFALYQDIYQSLAPQVPVPDLVIYLQASPETLIERVRRRANAYEQQISDEYLARLAQGYSDFFGHYAAAPVLFVNSEHLNFVDNDEHFARLLRCICDMRNMREFFSMDA